MWTRYRSNVVKEALKFRELDVLRRKTLIKSKSLNSIKILKASLIPIPINPPSITITPKMENPIPNIYPMWDDGVPLALTVLHEIAKNIFKTLLEFDVTIERTTYEHCVDVVDLAKTHNIQHEDIMVRLLA